MEQSTKDQVAKAVHTTLKRIIQRGGAIDLIDASDRICDAVELVVDMSTQDAGIASIPQDLRTDSPAIDWQDIQTAETAEKRHFISPPPAQSAATPMNPGRLIAMPGDAEFQDNPVVSKVAEESGRIKAKRRPIIRPSSNSQQKQYWTESDLIEEIDKNTPQQIPFDIQRADGSPFRIIAEKNIRNQQGLGSVVLTYKDARVGEGGDIPLFAQHPFSVYSEVIDIKEAMESVAKQLVGIYRDRSGGTPDPVAVGAEPDLNMIRAKISAGAAAGGQIDSRLGVGDAATVSLTPGQRVTGQTHISYEERAHDQILQAVLQEQKSKNSSLVPAGSRLNK